MFALNEVSNTLENSKLSSVEKNHCEKVIQCIQQEIQKNGPISFARYMELALYAPGLGYYVAGARKLGRDGDFVTAPEISSLFSKCVANKCDEVLSQIKNSSILELGAGSGKMALDILLHLSSLKHLPQHYFILEISADLKERQQELLKKTLPEFFSRIIWLDALPENFEGIVLANEVVDALPVHRFKIKNNEVYEVKVGCADNNFIEVDALADDGLANVVKQHGLPDNYMSEIHLNLQGWVAALAHTLSQGEMLFIDYGFPEHEYYHPDRSQGTLMCHYQHQAHDNPYILTGLQDITAHVNFSQLIDALEASGCAILNYDTQANFLINYGLIDELQRATNADNYLDLAQQVKVLTLPSEMGELFKVVSAKKLIS